MNDLETELDSAIRKGLVEAGVKGPLFTIVGPVLTAVMERLRTPKQSIEELAAAIEQHGGFLRTTGGAHINGEFVPQDRLIDALLYLERERWQRGR